MSDLVCIQCGQTISDDDAKWVNEEAPGHLYPGYPGDPVCPECFDKGRGSEPDTVDEYRE